MNKFNKMLVRDIKKYKFQMLAVIAIIFIGITLFSACVMSYKNLQIFKDNFYKDNNFLHAYIDGVNITDADIEGLSHINGITFAEGRLELEGLISLSDKTNATAKIIVYKKEPTINKLKYVSGKYIEDNSQILVSKNFAEYNKYDVNSNIKLKVFGKDLNFKVNGVIESPEFIITLKSRDYVMPSIKDYGIVYINYNVLKENFNFNDESYNQVHFKFSKNVNIDEVKKSIKEYLGDKYLYFTERDDQISEVMAREDIGMISEIAYMFPIMFLFAAALVIVIMQKKIIDIQRPNIGVLKAIGYKNSKIIFYYLKQSLLLGTTGTILSIIPSYYLSIYITKIYCELVYIPVSNFYFNWKVIGIAILLANLFAIIATLVSVKFLLKISAAEAMKPVNTNDVNINNKFVNISRKFSNDNRMVFRNLIRNPIRCLFTIVCYMIAFTLFAAPIFLSCSVNYAEYNQYKKIQNYDYKIVFNSSISSKEIDDFINNYNINLVSKAIELPIEIKNGSKTKELRIIGVENNYNIDDGKKVHAIPEEGVIIPKSIMEELNLNIDDEVNISLLSLNDKSITSSLKNSFDQYVGFSLYTDIDELRNIIDDSIYANCIYINDNNSEFKNIKSDIEENSIVKRIDTVKTEQSEFRTLLNLVNVFIIIMILFGFLMGFSSIYNSTMINIMDRRREWGTLKVLGYSNFRILKMSFKETIICFLLSIIPSILISLGTCYILGILMSNEFYTSPFIINYQMLIYPAIFVLLISFISLLMYYYSIKNINTAEIIKAKE